MLVVLWVTQNNNNDHGSMSVSIPGCYCAATVQTEKRQKACLCFDSMLLVLLTLLGGSYLFSDILILF